MRWLVSRSYRQCTGEDFGWLAYKLTRCDNGIQSEAAVAVLGCFSSCCKIRDWELLAVCLCCCLYGSQRLSEEFVHNTRCANISEAHSVGIAQCNLQWLSWTSRHQSLVGAQTIRSLLQADIWIGFTTLAWGNIGRESWETSQCVSGSAAPALAASLSTTLGLRGPGIGTISMATAKGSCQKLCARSEFKRQLPG